MPRRPLLHLKPVRLLAWLLVLLAAVLVHGCGGPSHHDLMRGAFAVPPPPARPGVGAPVVGQPGARAAPPRSPHHRVLPQTPDTQREPGLWAGDQPRAASAPWNGREPILLGLRLPDPDHEDPLYPLMLEQRVRCAHHGDALYDLKMRPEDLVAESGRVRACLAAYSWRHCAMSDVVDLERARDGGVRFMPQIEAALRANLADAERLIARTCTKDMHGNNWIARWLAVFGREWPRFNSRSSQ